MDRGIVIYGMRYRFLITHVAHWRKRLSQEEETMTIPGPEPDRGVYGISVAAELVGTGVQNLRLYEARGLLEPERTEGGTRRYSAKDLDRLRRIGELLGVGLNLAGIGMVLDLEAQNAQLRSEKEEHHWLTTAPITTPSPREPNFPSPSRQRNRQVAGRLSARTSGAPGDTRPIS
jgi:MerR family transcriptional regulator, heat shock protein HspR